MPGSDDFESAMGKSQYIQSLTVKSRKSLAKS